MPPLKRYRVNGTYQTKDSHLHNTSLCVYAHSAAEAKAKARRSGCSDDNLKRYKRVTAYREH